MGTTTAPNTYVVQTLYGPKTVTSLHNPHGTPLPGAPIFRRIPVNESSSTTTTMGCSETNRRAARVSSSLPYARPKLPPLQVSPPISSPNPTSPLTALDNALRSCVEHFQAEINHIGSVCRGAVYGVHQDARKWKYQCEAKDRELEMLRGKLRTFTLESNVENPPISSVELENETAKKFSMVGPLRSRSYSPSTPGPSKAQIPVSRRQSIVRSRSAEPYPLPQGANDCFDVTIVGYNTIPSQSTSAGKSPKAELIRDAINPDAPPRPCPRPAGPGEIDIHHIDIMYIPKDRQVFCRACCANNNNSKRPSEVKVFPNNASWDDLRHHFVTEHPTESQDIANLGAAELSQLRWRLRAQQSSSR